MSPQEYVRLIASHYMDSDSIKRILEYASVDTIHIDIDGKPINVWHESLKEAHRQGHLDELIVDASSEYPALKLNETEIAVLKEFLSANGSWYGNVPHGGKLKWVFGFGVLIVLALGAYAVKANLNNDIIIVLHKQGKRSARPVSMIGQLKIQDTSLTANFLLKPIGNAGVIRIEEPPKWLFEKKLRMDLQGLDNDTLTYSLSSRVYTFTKSRDTVWIDVSAVPKGPPLTTFEFIRLKYGTNDFDFLSSKSSLQLKKYMIFELDNKPDLFADRHVLRYQGDELANERILSTVNWTENRNLQLEYKMVPVALERRIELTVDNVNLRDALIFLGDEPGKVTEVSRSGSKIILPKLVGNYPLHIFYKDSVATIQLRTGYSDASKFLTADEFRRHSKKIRKVVK